MESQVEAQHICGEVRGNADHPHPKPARRAYKSQAVDAPKTLMLVSQAFFADMQHDDSRD